MAEAGGWPADGAKLLTELVEAERRGPDLLIDALLKQAGRFPADDLRAACLNLLPLAPGASPGSSVSSGRCHPLSVTASWRWPPSGRWTGTISNTTGVGMPGNWRVRPIPTQRCPDR